MLGGLLAALKARTGNTGRRRGRASSILLPFFIIAAGLGVLAWRSYELSARTEHGLETVARQYAAYTAEITAQRVDSAVRAETSRASEQWQQAERRSSSPNEPALQSWIHSNDWITSAIYVPDADPAGAVYVNERSGLRSGIRLTREFYTSSGLVRYTYDPARLLAKVRPALRQRPLIHARELSDQARVEVITGATAGGPFASRSGFSYVAPLAVPLSSYAIRAFVETDYGTSGWENSRVISLCLSLVALLLTAIGASLAVRGVRREAETMNLRAALIANVSHELRTPLSMIRLGAETLKRGKRLPEKQRIEIEDSILRESLHLSHLVENVLDIARMQNSHAKTLALTPVYPDDLVTTLVSTYESWIRSKGFEVRLAIDDTIDEQSWDREAVSRAVLNLIDNAIKYSGDEKLLEISVRQTVDEVIIEVRDRGIGIESADLSRIFEPYYRAEFSDTQTRRGAGLGLTLVQQIVASHGGRIEVESHPGAGSIFRLLFPRSPENDEEALTELTPQTT